LGVLHSEVAKAIDEQQAAIHAAVVDQTKAAVNALQPEIQSTIEKVTRSEITASVSPIQTQINTYADYIRLGNLATLARSDDRFAFEFLMAVALGKRPELGFKNADLVRLADATASAVITEKQYGLTLSIPFKEKQTPEAMKTFLTSSNPMEREAAIDNYPDADKSILPNLVELIRSDPNLSVLHKAVVRFNALTHSSFLFWQTQDLVDWWEKNMQSFQ